MAPMILIISIAIHLVIVTYVTSRGFELIEKTSWLYGSISCVCGLVSGFAICAVLGKPSAIETLITSLALGAIFMVMTMANGIVMRYHQTSAKIRDKRIEAIYLSLKRRGNKNYFARLAEKLLEKFV